MLKIPTLLRIEGLCLGLAAIVAYWHQGFSWSLIVALILVPDISMIGYLAGPRLGAICYNIVHATPLPWTLLLFGYFTGNILAVACALIWFAHIGIDRAMGYGLKLSSGFKDTHLGSMGR